MKVFFCDLAGARTQDPHIKSVMLYLLSYQVIELVTFNCDCKNTAFLNISNKNFEKFLIENSFALSSDKYLIISAIDNGTLLVFSHTAVDDDVDTVFIMLIYLLRIG